MTETTPGSDAGDERQSHRTGRRRGDSGTRDAIRAAARRQFADQGYDRTSLRSVAREAAVDPTLVGHFFGTKQQLFLAVTELPLVPETGVHEALHGDRAEIGRRLATFFVGFIATTEGAEHMTALVRAAATEDEGARLVRELLVGGGLTPAMRALGVDRPDLRAALVGSQIVGLVLGRLIIRMEPLVSLSDDQLIEFLSPTIQRYVVGPLPTDGVPPD